ncbi:hypothetical protein GC177_00930 [bacterium]|nr:hypothetical protein [bacterium]
MTESHDKKRAAPAPFCLRLSFEERAKLEQEAGNMSLGAYIRSRLFDRPTPRKRRLHRPVADQTLLAQLLTALGASRLAANLNQLAKAANSGSLPVTPDTEQHLHDACREVRSIRSLLMKALSQGGRDDS